MKIDFLDKRMRVYEELNDERLKPDSWTIARIDGKNFSRLTRQILKVKPFDERIRDAMMSALEALMQADYRVIYGFTQSDEISLLLHPYSNLVFNGKVRKATSVLASIAAVNFCQSLNQTLNRTHELPEDEPVMAYFDCRVKQYPNIETVLDYFAWRRIDSENNCLSSWCYYYLTQEDGLSPLKAQSELDGKKFDWKNEYLFQHDVNFDKLPGWQKRGVGMYWVDAERPAMKILVNKEGNKTGEEPITVKRQELLPDMWIDKKIKDYRRFIHYKITSACNTLKKDETHQTDRRNLCLPYPIAPYSDRYAQSSMR